MKKIEIEIKTDCKNCTHQEVCKFRHAAADLFKSNMMYSMFEYLEWNHLLDSFDTNAKGCKFYKPTFVDGPIQFGVTPNTLLNYSLHKWFSDQKLSWGRWITPLAGIPTITLKGEAEPRPNSFFEEHISLKRI